ncbi:MAG TPA: pentapeptide repeat-containing protein [Candidatus Dormibacteraeota bacterium]|nr:pentapeptide repeat-containing protein [Candidatus Dormibacteraeota bacterium]
MTGVSDPTWAYKGVYSPRVPEDLVTVEAAEFLGELRGVSLLGATLAETAGPLLVDGGRLTRTDLSATRFLRPSLGDLVFSNCNLANLHWGSAAMTRTTFQECQMTGFDVNSSTLVDVQFQGCKLSLSSFRFLAKAKVRFVDCEMDGTDFHGVDLRACRFENCILTGSLFHGAKSEGVDLRGSSLTGLQGIDGLRGAVIDQIQLLDLADSLASHAGLTVLVRN